VEHPERILHATRPWRRRHDIPWREFPTVVFESDDWGACEVARTTADAAALAELWPRPYGGPLDPWRTLESPADLDRLYQTLEHYRGCDGQAAVFTAFMVVANPDYRAIATNGYTAYADVGIDRGTPPGWDRGDLGSAWRDGLARGVFVPEYHARLHHASPVVWMELLHAAGHEGDAARAAFAQECYYQGHPMAEYIAMNVRQQHVWLEAGLEYFRQAFGTSPAVVACSDAYSLTETLWAVHGLRTISLKFNRGNHGEVIVDPGKPWNNQDPFVPMGAYNEIQDVVYLGRNVTLEDEPVDQVLEAIQRCWEANEPAIIGSHRHRYVSLDRNQVEDGYARLEMLLSRLVALGNVRFLSAAEVSDMYRRGWSWRRAADHYVLRQYTGRLQEMVLPAAVNHVSALPGGVGLSLMRQEGRAVLTLPSGDFLVRLSEG
jgi:hypothetical protein